jgi:hypothetical protein
MSIILLVVWPFRGSNEYNKDILEVEQLHPTITNLEESISKGFNVGYLND